MSRYIDADKIPRHGKRGGECYWQEIEQLQTADVVEVVRCGNCKYWQNYNDVMVCGLTNAMMSVSDYCSYGEREDE